MDKIDESVEGTPPYAAWWYDLHPHTKILNQMDCSIPYEDQFNIIKSIDWTQEKPQVDLFCSLLNTVKCETPSIIEVGSQGIAGSFYSVLFEKWFRGNCKIINVELYKYLVDEVKVVWKNKHLVNAMLYHGYVGVVKHYQTKPIAQDGFVPQIKIKDLMDWNNLNKVDFLHADIQGSEISLCEELKEDGLLDKIRYLFISTHTGENINTYYPCLEILKNNMNCLFHYSDPHSGGWGDGLIVVENLKYCQ